MSKIKAQSIIFGATIVFIILIVAFLLYPFDFEDKDINQIYKENPGALWVLTTSVILTATVINYFIIQVMGVIKNLAVEGEEKSIFIKDQNEKMMTSQTNSVKRDMIHADKLEKLTESIASREVWHIQKWGELAEKVFSIHREVDSHTKKIETLERLSKQKVK